MNICLICRLFFSKGGPCFLGRCTPTGVLPCTRGVFIPCVTWPPVCTALHQRQCTCRGDGDTGRLYFSIFFSFFWILPSFFSGHTLFSHPVLLCFGYYFTFLVFASSDDHLSYFCSHSLPSSSYPSQLLVLLAQMVPFVGRGGAGRKKTFLNAWETGCELQPQFSTGHSYCLLYTSDAADE